MTVASIPSSILDASDLVVAVLYSRNIYHSLCPSSLRAISPVFSLNIYRDQLNLKVDDLNEPVYFKFQFNLDIPQVKAIVEDVFVRHTRSKQ